ncbi:MAG TPA: FKBP-type peptidyl-prolyl cis-trans isomerase [Candidatus Paceibacterota bacterium]|nr:FKBP-type peptidyl-prolyl cis-trans isomerase [Candidatus Paceibacterota bacterium]
MHSKKFIQGVAATVAFAVLALFFVVFGNPLAAGFPGAPDQANGTQPPQLIVQDEVVGTGAEARPGDTLLVNYTGKLDDGTVFDTSVGRTPYPFVLGAGSVIQGWDQGLQGMKVGGKRLLIVPPALGYGAAGNGPIPPNATLVFEVELVGVTPQGQ